MKKISSHICGFIGRPARAALIGPRPTVAMRASDSRGFTMTELIIAIFITGIISAAVYAVYTNYYRQSSVQDLMLEAQQNARVGINLMERELMNAGYAAGTADIITRAESADLEFIYTDPSTDASMSATAGKRLKVRYELKTYDGIKYLTRKQTNMTDSVTGDTEKMIPYLQSLQFTYYDVDGDEITSISDQNDRNTIRFISVAIVTQTKDPVQATGSPKTFMVETHIRLRNIGIGQTALDSTPPSAPVDPQVRDPGLCGRLKVKWTLNTEGDVSGYKVYYGTSSGDYTGVINVPVAVLSGSTYSCTQSSGSMECTLSPSSPALTYTPSNAAAGSETVYYLAVKAYDNSLNHSNYSTEVYGNPDPSNPTYGTGTNDSTLNPVKPVAVTGIGGANPSEGDIQLSWDSYDTETNPDVVGFRVYRSASPFSSYPIDPTEAGIDWVAGEPGSGKPSVSSADSSYTDSDPSLVGCRVYYYAIAPVNCDATLITDEGSDPDSKKYLQTDYDATCGDGSTSCSPGSGFSASTGSDTAPEDTGVPDAPGIGARAGWKRVALSVTQPSASDLDQTCVYVNEGVQYPALLTDTETYPLTDGCYQVNTSSTPNAIRLIEDDGIFTVSELSQSSSTSFWHNSMTEITSIPSLMETGTYSYRAVSFDLCANASNITAAQATTTLCGEDPQSGEKPPAVTGAGAAACASPVTLSWTGVSSDISQPSTPTNPYDLAGYRVFSSSASGDWSSATLLNPVAPYWGTTYQDTAITDGGTYYYRVVSTDCPYERVNPPSNVIRDDMISGTLNSAQVGPVYPGRIDRDEKCPGVGSCAKDDHREVLTGVTIDNAAGNGTGATTPSSGLTHHTVTMFLDNTSAGTMTVTGASVSWVGSTAFLRKITIGGGRSGVGQTFTDIASGLTTTVAGNPPYTRAVSNATLTSAQIAAGARYAPITLEFKDSDGNAVDMRDDQLLITLYVRNDSTGTTSCLTYLTVSRSLEGVFVPFGPSITAAQQDKPSSPTFGYAVPGSTGLNTVPSGSEGTVVADSGVTVNVSADVSGNTTDETTGTKVPVSSVKLYYKVTVNTVTTAPASGFTEVTMTNASGNIWTGAIPSNDGFRVWYYMVAVDADGNFDRDPEVAHGAYVYDQKEFDVCEVTPSEPTGAIAVASGSDVTVKWDAVTTYTNGATINPVDTIKYRVYRGGSLIASDLTTTTYVNTGLAAGVYTYTVRATNACSTPGPKVSSDSNTAAACVGLSGSFTLDVSPTEIYQGQSYNVTILDCLAIYSTYATTVETINSTAGYFGFSNTSSVATYSPTITETGPATALFPITIGTTASALETGKLRVAQTDTITVTYAPVSPGVSRTVQVVVDPCTNTPKAPASLTGSVTGQNMGLTWSAVTLNTDDTSIADLAGYRVYEKVCADGAPNCTGSDIVKDWFLRTTTDSATTSVTVAADQGNVSQRIYYFKVKAYDSCSVPVESAYSDPWNETR